MIPKILCLQTLLQVLITVIKRNMKNIIYLSIVLIFVQACFAQEGYNSLNDTQYANVKFQGVSLEAIKNSNGNVRKMKALFLSETNNDPNAFTIDEFGSEIGEPQRVFYFNSELMISFDLGGPSEPIEIDRLESNEITILGHHLEIGDSIDVLSNEVEFNTNIDGSKSLLFIKNNGACCPIIINFDSNHKITSIVYLILA